MQYVYQCKHKKKQRRNKLEWQNLKQAKVLPDLWASFPWKTLQTPHCAAGSQTPSGWSSVSPPGLCKPGLTSGVHRGPW